jgi:plastocyanin
MRPMTWMAVAAVAGAVAVAGCGGGSSSSSSSGSGGSGSSSSGSSGSSGGSSGGSSSKRSATGQTLKLGADPNKIAFDKTTLNAKAGQVTIAFSNPSAIPHAVEVEGNGIEKKTPTITNGNNKLALHLKPGTYEFYCPVDGHKQAGMKGTLTVK